MRNYADVFEDKLPIMIQLGLEFESLTKEFIKAINDIDKYHKKKKRK